MSESNATREYIAVGPLLQSTNRFTVGRGVTRTAAVQAMKKQWRGVGLLPASGSFCVYSCPPGCAVDDHHGLILVPTDCSQPLPFLVSGGNAHQWRVQGDRRKNPW